MYIHVELDLSSEAGNADWPFTSGQEAFHRLSHFWMQPGSIWLHPTNSVLWGFQCGQNPSHDQNDSRNIRTRISHCQDRLLDCTFWTWLDQSCQRRYIPTSWAFKILYMYIYIYTHTHIKSSCCRVSKMTRIRSPLHPTSVSHAMERAESHQGAGAGGSVNENWCKAKSTGNPMVYTTTNIGVSFKCFLKPIQWVWIDLPRDLTLVGANAWICVRVLSRYSFLVSLLLESHGPNLLRSAA